MLTRIQPFPEGTEFLAFVFKETSSVVSATLVKECLTLLLVLDPEHLKLSLDE